MAFESDLAYLQAALSDLRDYIFSKDLYWPLRLPPQPGSAVSPQLTIGNLALAQARLAVIPANGSQSAEVDALNRQIQSIRDEWRSNWSIKAAKEFSSRLNLWQQYLRELRGDPRGQAAYFSNEVRQRAILQVLRAELLEGVPAHEEEQLAMLDGLLRGLTRPGSFVWEAEVQPAFSPKDYWFLYVHFD